MARKKNEELEQEVVAEAGQGEFRVYEVGFHIDPEVAQEEVKQLCMGLKETISSVGTIIATGKPEKITLAYTISRMEHSGRHDFSAAYFAWIAYETTPEGHETVLEAVKADQRIFRFIDVLTTKEAALHAAEQRELRARTPEKAEGGEADEVSEEELDAALEEATS